MSEWTYRLAFHPYPDALIAPSRIDLGARRLGDVAVESEARRPDASLDLFGELAEHPLPDFTFGFMDGYRVRIGDRTRVDRLPGRVSHARYPIFVDVAAGEELGHFYRALSISAPGFPPLSTEIAWSVIGPLKANPAVIHFGVLRPDDSSRERSVVINANGGRVFRISGVESSSREVTVSAVDPAASSSMHRVAATFHAKESRHVRPVTGHLLIKTDIAGGSLKIPFSAFMMAPSRGGRDQPGTTGPSDTVKETR